MEHYCNHCNKEYKSYQSLWNHNKKFHSVIINKNKQTPKKTTKIHKQFINKNQTKPKTYNCRHCDKEFSFVQARHRHEKTCKTKINILEENKKLKSEINELLNKNTNHPVMPINNQLINMIVDKTNTIQELKTKIDNKSDTIVDTNNEIYNISIDNKKLLEEIRIRDEKIKLLENTYVKKQKRNNYKKMLFIC